MEPTETHVGWVIFELGYAHDRYINFVLYPQLNAMYESVYSYVQRLNILLDIEITGLAARRAWLMY